MKPAARDLTAATGLHPPSAVLLDLDGTLTVPRLDFAQILRDMGLPPGHSILEALADMDPATRAEAEAVLGRHEREAAEGSELAEGCRELLGWLAGRDVPFAIITRNSRASLATVCARHGLPACVTVARDDAAHKPDPAPLHLACARLGRPAGSAWMVGDGQFDVEAGRAAGMTTVWLTLGRPARPFAAEPTASVRALPELLDLLKRVDAVT